ENAASYRPGRSGAYPDWTVAGWIVPVASLWVPYRITADIWRGRAGAAVGSPATPGRGGGPGAAGDRHRGYAGRRAGVGHAAALVVGAVAGHVAGVLVFHDRLPGGRLQ